MKYNREITQQVYQRIIGAMSGLSDIHVEVHEKVQPHFDSEAKAVRMPYEISYAKDDEQAFEFGKGICVHEGSHVLFAPDLYPDARKIQAMQGEDAVKDFCEWMNVFCDANNEYKIVQIFPHLKETLKNKSTGFIKLHPEILKSGNPFMQVLVRIAMYKDEINPTFPDGYPDEIKEFIKDVAGKYISRDLDSAKGEELIEYGKEVLEKWLKLKKKVTMAKDQEEAESIFKDLAEAIKKGDKAAKEALEKKLKEATEKFEFKDGVDRRLLNDNKGDKKKKSVTTPDYSNLTLEEIKKMLDEKRETEEINPEPDTKGGWGNLWIEDDIDIRSKRPEASDNPDETDWTKAYQKGKSIHRGLKKKIELLEDFKNNHRSGRLDMEEVRTQVSKVGRIYKPTLFERNQDFRRGGEWAISVLCDCSGSMYGKNIVDAKQALATLAYALDGLPNVHYELVGFTESGRAAYDLFVKKYDDRKLNTENLSRLRAGDGNADGFNLREATKRISRFKNMKKLIVVISDGQPAYNYRGLNGVDDMKQLVKKITSNGISIIGIGIEGAHPLTIEEIYPVHYFFKDTTNLDRDITALLLNALNHKVMGKKKLFVNENKFSRK